MRNRFIQLLCNWAREDETIYLLTADLGFSVLEPFVKEFPKRFINVGIAEQNMIGIATGLSLLGKKVFVYSIVNFGTIRCLEQIRNDVCYHNAHVIVTIVGAGLAYGVNGYTHLGVEDLAVMLPMPKMKVLSPADSMELQSCMDYLKKKPGPAYLRLAKGGEPTLHAGSINIEQTLNSDLSADINIICHGTIFSEVIKTKQLLKEYYNVHVNVFSIPLLKPFPNAACLHLLSRSKHVFLIEEHMLLGGMSSLVSSLATSLGPDCPYIYAYGINEKILHAVGDQTYLRHIFRLNAENLLQSILTDLSITEKLAI